MSEILLLFESFVVVGGRTLLHGTALALVTWLICATLLRKARPALHAALWTVVLFKFLVPPILPGEMALSGLMGSLVRGSLGVGTASSLLVLPAGTGSAGASAGMVTPLAVVESVSWTTMLLAGYLAALLLVAGTALLKTMRTFAELRRLPLAGSELNALVAQLAARLGLRRPPRIRVTDRTVSPYVIGLTFSRWNSGLELSRLASGDPPAEKETSWGRGGRLRVEGRWVEWRRRRGPV